LGAGAGPGEGDAGVEPFGERLGDRRRDGAGAETTQATLRAIASHELDPYSAADQLLESLAEKAGGR